MAFTNNQANPDQIALSLHARALQKRHRDGYIADTFLKLTGASGPIPGESTDPSHKDEIEVDAFELDMHEDIIEERLGQLPTGHVHTGHMAAPELYFIMRVNKATIGMWTWMSNGEPPMPLAVLSCRKAGKGGKDFFVVTMERVSVAQIKTIDTGEDDPTPICFVRLVFERIKLEYQEVKPDGSASGKHAANYDFKSHKGG